MSNIRKDSAAYILNQSENHSVPDHSLTAHLELDLNEVEKPLRLNSMTSKKKFIPKQVPLKPGLADLIPELRDK